MSQQAKILEQVAIERLAQDHKWGEQNHPDVLVAPLGPRDRPFGDAVLRTLRSYGVPTAREAQAACDAAAHAGVVTWAHIAIEELCEAIEAALEDPGNLRTELIQTLAVLTAWVECIDRKAAS